MIANTVQSIGPPRLTLGMDKLPRIDRRNHRALHGPLPKRSLRDLIALSEAVDLRGRGGAAFPFARKLKAVADSVRSQGRQPEVAVNATEGEPAAGKDKMLLARAPHLILDGAVLVANALNARSITIGVTDGAAPEGSLRAAVQERRLGGLISVVRLPERFVTGESSALVKGINGEPAIPNSRKVRASDSGVGGRPSLVSNAETFAQLAILVRLGPEMYGAVGTREEPGTVLLSVSGSARRPSVVEAPAGVPLLQVLDRCGADPGQGVLIGGYHGAWLTPRKAMEAPVSREGMKRAGASLGAGIIVPLDDNTCPLGEIARVAEYMGDESAGQCGPCVYGLPAIADSLIALVNGRDASSALAAVRRGVGVVRGRGACHHPDGTTKFLLSGIETFAEDLAAHTDMGSCGRKVQNVLPVPDDAGYGSAIGEDESKHRLVVDWARCVGHGLCGHLAPELVRLDEHGFPILSDSPVPRRLLKEVNQAIEMCPALALRLDS